MIERIDQLRKAAIIARRAWTRGRSRLTPEAVAALRRVYGRANRLVKDEIRKAKNGAWRELIATLDVDPWGLPYRLVLKRLKRSSPGLTMTMEPAVLECLLSELFPSGREFQPAPLPDFQWVDGLGFSSADVARALQDKRNPNTAPGPDGLKAAIWKKVPAAMLHCLAGCFTTCLKHGIFPARWKVADLVLIPKGESPWRASEGQTYLPS